MKKISEMNMEELETRSAEIRDLVKEPDANLEELEKEADEIAQRMKQFKEEQRRRSIAAKVAGGAGTPAENPTVQSGDEARAAKFYETRRGTFSCEETRSTLMSSGNLVAPTGVSGINDIVGAKVSSIIDLVSVVNCEGMSSNKIAYVDEDIDAADDQTEGEEGTEHEPTFKSVTITPTSALVMSYISKQVRKQSPLQYEAKVRAQSMIALRKKAAMVVTAGLKASELVDTVNGKTDGTKKGVIDATTLRTIALAYGGDESVVGGAVLFLNKKDLMAFGDVRGTNEKKPIYEITPDSGNPNTGVIKDGGLSVRYCINSNMAVFNGTAQTAAPQKTMFYGVPSCIELDLFSAYEIAVSEDFKFSKAMDSIRGDVELGSAVTVKGGFVALTIPANS